MADILFECRDGAAWVTLNRPASRNSVTAEMTSALLQFLLSIEHDASIRCVLLRGAGEHFMAGGDVKNFAATLELTPAQRRAQFEARVHLQTPLLLTLQRMPQIFVAAVKGACAGMGLSWVAAADLAIAARSAFFVQSQIKIAVTPDASATFWPPRLVGLKRAKEIALLGERFSAEDAERWGLINRVVDDADFDRAVDELVAKIASGPAAALGATKRLLNQSLENSYAAQLAAEAEAFAATAASADFAEGVTSFIEKRAARFGREGEQ